MQLMNPAAVGASVQNAFDMGQEKARQVKLNESLRAYGEAPSQETAKGVLPHDPRLGIQLGQVEQQRAAQLQQQEHEEFIKELTGLAAQGDPQAMVALWSESPEMAMKLDDRQAKAMADGYEFIANAAFHIIQLPPEQRPAAWDSYVQQGVAMGYDGLSQYLGKYSEEALNGAVAKARQMPQFQRFQQPDYMPVGEGGLAGFQFGQPIEQGGAPQNFAPPSQNLPRISSPAEAMNLPPGTQFVDPHGQVRVVPGGASGNAGGNFQQ